MKLLVPTPEQQAILDAKERLVVVRACPGSGKTSVFAEKVRALSSSWDFPRKGIAALSFTNAASEEIFERVGASLLPPHFIGTLDSFILRFVILAFGQYFCLPEAGARLVPSPLDERLKFSPFKYGSTNRDQAPISSFRIVGGTIEKPTLDFYDPILKKRVPLADSLIDKAMAMKRKHWKGNGLITHSDSHYLAASLLTDHEHRAHFISLIAKRFPVILVDEFQDTTWFLSQVVMSLFGSASISGLVVGDPDQSIYQFGGAPNNLFEQIEQLSGSKRYPMTLTRRFGKNICAVASALSQSQTAITHPPDKPDGRVVLVIHALQDKHLSPELLERIITDAKLTGEIVVLSRKTRICRRFNPLTNLASFPGGSRLAAQIDEAVFFLRRGDNTRAAHIVSRELWNLLTAEEGLPTTRELSTRGLTRRKWNQHLYQILLESDKAVEGELWNGWLSRVKEAFETVLRELGLQKKLGILFKNDNKGNVPRPTSALTVNAQGNYRVLTIHQAKGLEFHNVIFFLNKPDKGNNVCVSSQWWESDAKHLEEKRVGFVAMSRSKDVLVVCMHQDTFKNLQKLKPDFIGLFSETIALQAPKQNAPAKKASPGKRSK